MGLPQLRPEERYTFEDWLSWDESERWELIDGKAYMMSTPLQRHQEVSGASFYQLYHFLRGKPCKVFPAPFGVRLFEEEDTVLEPDVFVVCDTKKLDGKVCNGAPDLVIEILSPSTSRRDKLVKFNKYQQAGVREYWIVDPDTKSVQVSILEGGRYYVTAYGDEDTAPVSVLPGCEINLAEVFAE